MAAERGAGGYGPMMGGGPAGAGGRGGEHRNHVFIPSDEPFAVPLGDDTTEAVIGGGEA
jgi:hypothetical protein